MEPKTLKSGRFEDPLSGRFGGQYFMENGDTSQVYDSF